MGGPPPLPPPPRRASACHPLSRASPPGVYSCCGSCRAAAGVGRGPVGCQRASAVGGGGGAPPPPRPVGRPPAIRCLRRAPPGYTRAVGVAGRPRASGAVRSAANGPVRWGGGGGAPFALSWAPPVRRRPAAGGACGRLPRPWCPRTPGAGASSWGVRGRCFLGLPLSAHGPEWEGGGEWGGPSGPLPSPPDGRGGGRHGGPGPAGQPSAGGSHPSPAPLYLEPDPRAGLCWGISSPLPSSRGAGRPGAAVRVRGQRLAGCGAAGSPPRSLSPPSLPREVARALASRRTVGGAWVGGPSPPPPFLASAVWAVTCAAACVGAGAVAAAGCAGGSTSGRGRCTRPGGASCWRPHP